jgi:hypothetical protein
MTKTITVILQFEQDKAYTVTRPVFRAHFTDVIRTINADPNLGKLKSAHMALADTMNSIAPLDAGAYGAPQAALPKTWQRCNACTNDKACAAAGGCIAATRAVDEAAKKLNMRRGITITGQSGVRVVEEDFLPGTGQSDLLDVLKETRAGRAKKPAQRPTKKAPPKKVAKKKGKKR